MTKLKPGEIYRVPCVRTIWPSISETPTWIPVNGPMHHDEEIINIGFFHWHLDWRFLSKKQMESIKAQGYGSWNAPREDEVFINIIADIHPDLGHEWIRENQRRPDEGWDFLEDLPVSTIRTETYIRLKPRRYNGEYPPYPEEFMMRGWLPELEQAYRDHRIKENLICPHKGGDLRGSPVVDGKVTCPLHGLRWDLRTGKLAPREDDEEQVEEECRVPGARGQDPKEGFPR